MLSVCDPGLDYVYRKPKTRWYKFDDRPPSPDARDRLNVVTPVSSSIGGQPHQRLTQSRDHYGI